MTCEYVAAGISDIPAATIFIPVILSLEMPELSVHGRIIFRNEIWRS